MPIEREHPGTRRGPEEWFTGAVWLDVLASADDAGPAIEVFKVNFSPGARTAWHSHPSGQVLLISDGAGLVQSRGGGIEHVHAGDRVSVAPGEEHWHGAGPGTFMAHIAIQAKSADGKTTDWGEHVSDDEYTPR